MSNRVLSMQPNMILLPVLVQVLLTLLVYVALAVAKARALAGMARAELAAGNIERARQMLAMAPPEVASDPAILAARSAIDLAELTQDIGETAELQARLDRLAARLEVDPEHVVSQFEALVEHDSEGLQAGARKHADVRRHGAELLEGERAVELHR